MSEPRFAFGRNWQRLVARLEGGAIDSARAKLVEMLGTGDLGGRRMLDIGSGSGLMSLAARQLGAQVTSFDYDADSVGCTREVRQRYRPDDVDWTVAQGSALDEAYMAKLGTFDLVYAWGVLHHTGAMWRAMELAAAAVAPGGTFYVALYNDQGWISRYWLWIKRNWVRRPWTRPLAILVHAPYFIGLRWLVWVLRGRGGLARGMDLWIDLIDWLGGYPFEVASRDSVRIWAGTKGFDLSTEASAGRRHGCNEFVLRRKAAP
ncbi:MAG: class I SAM-dependent methyltransferase [Alphaproteobacteria bacterium]|nr:class I SAM-dependent methyltransferase [Alphaproteobacteria bacterium]